METLNLHFSFNLSSSQIKPHELMLFAFFHSLFHPLYKRMYMQCCNNKRLKRISGKIEEGSNVLDCCVIRAEVLNEKWVPLICLRAMIPQWLLAKTEGLSQTTSIMFNLFLWHYDVPSYDKNILEWRGR